MTTKTLIERLAIICEKRSLHPTELYPSVKWAVKTFGVEATATGVVMETQRLLCQKHPEGYLVR